MSIRVKIKKPLEQLLEKKEKEAYHRINLQVKVKKKADTDITDVFNQIRGINGVTTLRQEKAVADMGTFYLCDIVVKFLTKGVPLKQYVYNVLVNQINSEMEVRGIPGATVRMINWNSLDRAPKN